VRRRASRFATLSTRTEAKYQALGAPPPPPPEDWVGVVVVPLDEELPLDDELELLEEDEPDDVGTYSSAPMS